MLRINIYFLYFVMATPLVISIKLAGGAVGLQGFVLAPYQNAASALSVLLMLVAVFIHTSIFGKQKQFVLPKEGAVAITALLFLALNASIIGLASGNSLQYVISTSIYFVNAILFIYLIFFTDLSDEIFTKTTKYIAITIIVAIFIGHGGSFQANLFVFAVVSIVFMEPTPWKFRLLLLVPVALQVATQNRSTLLAFIVMLIFAAVVKRRSLWFLAVSVVVISVFLFLSFGNLQVITEPGTQMYRRLSEIQSLIQGSGKIEDMVALQQRLYEIRVVNETMSNANILSVILGNGFGSTVDMTSSADSSVTASSLLGASRTHNIHSLIHSIYLRYGIFGLGLFLALCSTMVMNVIRAMHIRRLSPMATFAILYPIGRIVSALPAGNYFYTDFITIALVQFAAFETKKALSLERNVRKQIAV